MGDIADANMSQKARPSLAFSPAAGVPQQYLAKVNDQFVSAAKAKGVEVVDAREAQYVIKPSYTAAADGKKGVKLVYAIDVTDKAGNQVRRLDGEEVVSDKRGGDAWSHVTEEAVLRVTQKSVAELGAWVDNPTAAPVAMASMTPAPAQAQAKPKHEKKVVAAAKPATPPAPAPTLSAAAVVTPVAPAPAQTASAKSEIAAVVPIVSGAPGDGKVALSEAMKRALTQQGIKVASKAANAYRIQGQVEVGAPENGSQSIIIRWVVLDPSGKQMEKSIVQKNKVNEGRLEQPWAEIAEQAAGAAALEVSKLLNSTSSAQGDAAKGRSAG